MRGGACEENSMVGPLGSICQPRKREQRRARKKRKRQKRRAGGKPRSRVTKPPEAERPNARSQRPVGIRGLTGTKMVRHRSPQVYARNVVVTDRDFIQRSSMLVSIRLSRSPSAVPSPVEACGPSTETGCTCIEPCRSVEALGRGTLRLGSVQRSTSVKKVVVRGT